MSILNSDSISEAMKRKRLTDRLIVTPLLDRQEQLGHASIDLRLGTEFIEVERHREATYDPMEDRDKLRAAAQQQQELTLTVPLGGNVVLHPGQFILGSTLEFVHLPSDIAGQLLSRSSWGRVGLIVATAVTLQPGWIGMVTLELANQGSVPIRLYPGLRVAQLVMWSTGAEESGPPALSQPRHERPLGPQATRLPLENVELDRILRVAEHLGARTRARAPVDTEAADAETARLNP